MRVQTVATASAGIEKLQSGGDFDLVLVGPLGLSSAGTDWVNEMRNICSGKHIPIVSLTVKIKADQTLQQELNAAASLSKPIHPVLLFETIRSVISHLETTHDSGDRIIQPILRQKPARALRILMAEDNQINREVAMFMLGNIGYKADAVENGQEALELLRSTPYDVVLMDVQMPVMDGFEASREIWREFAKEDRPYIIAMTACAMSGDRERCLAAGMDAYISKPVDVKELSKALARVP